MRIDLHTHSNVSDGTQTPTELVRAAADAGLDVVALTDHDTTVGWAEALAAADTYGVAVVPGIEVSTRAPGGGAHLLAYRTDPDHAGLAEVLTRVRSGRGDREPAMIEKLREVGSQITAEDVRRVSGSSESAGRPHIADALVAIGEVADRDEAFARFLNPGRPGYLDRYAPLLSDAVALVVEAGGVAVIAHPWGRNGGSGHPDEATFARLAEAGLAGIEVDHQDHSPQDRDQLRAIARNLDLIITGSSDHHGLGKTGHELGCNTTDPAQYERLMAQVSN
ncbi:PHP domain-containing protein [Nocardioides salsibiostraticola]